MEGKYHYKMIFRGVECFRSREYDTLDEAVLAFNGNAGRVNGETSVYACLGDIAVGKIKWAGSYGIYEEFNA